MHTFITIDQTGNVTSIDKCQMRKNLANIHPSATHRITVFSDCITRGYIEAQILEMAGMLEFSNNVLQMNTRDGNRYFERMTGPRPDGFRYEIDLNIESH